MALITRQVDYATNSFGFFWNGCEYELEYQLDAEGRREDESEWDQQLFQEAIEEYKQGQQDYHNYGEQI